MSHSKCQVKYDNREKYYWSHDIIMPPPTVGGELLDNFPRPSSHWGRRSICASMLGQHLRCWPNIETQLGQRHRNWPGWCRQVRSTSPVFSVSIIIPQRAALVFPPCINNQGWWPTQEKITVHRITWFVAVYSPHKMTHFLSSTITVNLWWKLCLGGPGFMACLFA